VVVVVGFAVVVVGGAFPTFKYWYQYLWKLLSCHVHRKLGL
jgi:hypothetical protein